MITAALNKYTKVHENHSGSFFYAMIAEKDTIQKQSPKCVL